MRTNRYSGKRLFELKRREKSFKTDTGPLSVANLICGDYYLSSLSCK
jgi:hypothetical protein